MPKHVVELPPEWAGGSLAIQTRVTKTYPGMKTPRQITVVITVDPDWSPED